MKKPAKGFTIIEVTLFLAVSVLMLMAVVGVTSSNVARRRYNDSVDGIVSYLRSAYSSVISVENIRETDNGSQTYFCSISSDITSVNGAGISSDSVSGTDNYPGRTNCVIYGKLVTFGELDPVTKKPSEEIHMYDVIGTVYRENINIAVSDPRMALKKSVKANVVTPISKTGICELNYAGQGESFTPGWRARVENPDGSLYTGAILIARSPLSGTVRTYVYTGSTNHILDINDEHFADSANGFAFDINYAIANAPKSSAKCEVGNLSEYVNLFQKKFLNSTITTVQNPDGSVVVDDSKSYLEEKTATLCVGSDDAFALHTHRAIQILEGGNNTTAVKLADEDGDISKECNP